MNRESHKCRVLIFDFDGVIADSMRIHERAWRFAIARNSLDPQSEHATQIIRNLYSGSSGDGMFRGVNLSEAVKRSLRVLKDAEWSRTRDKVKLFRYGREGIVKLSQSFVLSVASTASPEFIRQFLSTRRLISRFSAIATNMDVQNGKPAPDMIYLLAQRLAFSMEEAVMIGDTEADRVMAKAANIRFVPFGARWHHAASVTSWRDLDGAVRDVYQEPGKTTKSAFFDSRPP